MRRKRMSMLACRGLLLGDLVELEGEIPAQHVHRTDAGRVRAGAARLAELQRDLRHVAGRDGRIHRADVDHAAVLDAVQPRVPLEGPRAVELQDETAVVGDHGRGLRRAAELRRLPRLALVLAQVLDDERFDVRDAQQPLARGVDGEAAQVAGDPAAAQLFGDGRGGAAAAEAVEDEVALVRGGIDDAFEEGFGFLGWIADSLMCDGVYIVYVRPNVLDKVAFGFIQVTLQAWSPGRREHDSTFLKSAVDPVLRPNPMFSRGGLQPLISKLARWSTPCLSEVPKTISPTGFFFS